MPGSNLPLARRLGIRVEGVTSGDLVGEVPVEAQPDGSIPVIWMLAYHDLRQLFRDTPTVTMLRDRVRHAILKEPFWSVIQDPTTRAD